MVSHTSVEVPLTTFSKTSLFHGGKLGVLDHVYRGLEDSYLMHFVSILDNALQLLSKGR